MSENDPSDDCQNDYTLYQIELLFYEYRVQIRQDKILPETQVRVFGYFRWAGRVYPELCCLNKLKRGQSLTGLALESQFREK